MVLNLDGENYYDTIVNTEIDNYLNSVIVDVLNYEYEPAEAMSRISQWKNIGIIWAQSQILWDLGFLT